MRTRKIEVQHQQSPQALQRVLHLLKRRGFRVRQDGVQLPAEGLRRGLRLDYLLEWSDRRFGLDVKAARELADWLFHWLARPILALQAARRLQGWEPLVAVHVEALDGRAVRHFKAQAALYAPDLWWLLADPHGRLVAHLPGGDEEAMGESRSARGVASRSPSVWSASAVPLRPAYARARLSFGDLDQWLAKVLLFARSDPGSWGGPRGEIGNLAQLAELAGVARPLVYRWAAAMERSGYLGKAMGRNPVLRGGTDFLEEWRGRYRIHDQDAVGCVPVFGERVDTKFIAGFLDRLRELPPEAPPIALTGHQACRLFRLKHSDARSIHLYVAGDPAPLFQHLQVVPGATASAPIVFLRPRHPRSALGGVSRIGEVPVCDPLQVYLDLYHLPDRGREQAEVVYDRLVAAVLRKAAEAPA